MHSIAASAARRAALPGVMVSIGSSRVFEGTNEPLACRHFSKKGRISVARSLITGKFSSGPISIRPPAETFATWVRHVHRGRPLTIIAHEPHTPTRQANRQAQGGS